MDNPDAAAPETYTKKDQEKASNNGKTAGLTIAVSDSTPPLLQN
jgi:hypothetical protein